VPQPAKVSRLWLETLEDRVVPSFLPPVNYPTGTNPLAVVTADLNGDGRLDLITANAGDNTISVRLGNGDGTFGAAQTYAVGTGPDSVAVGDFNGDGKLDIVTANEGNNTVSVLLGNGDGAFGAAQSYAVGSQPASVAVGDFDGKLDVVTANQGDNTVSLLPGNGDGTFAAFKTVATLTSPAQSVAVGDLNADGKLDLAVTAGGTDGYTSPGGYYIPGTAPTVNVLLGNGDGTFALGSSLTLPSFSYVPPSSIAPPTVAVADLNGDGHPDLVTTYADYGGIVNVFLNNGNGTFAALGGFGAGGNSQAVAVADLNGDGKPDLVTADGNGISVLPGNGKGTFGDPAFFTDGTNPVAVAAGDFNGDGLTDLAVADSGSNNVSVLLNTGFWPTLGVAATDPVTGAALTSTTAGNGFNFTVTADDPSGNVLTGYTDSVVLSSTDPAATIIDPATGNPVALENFTYTFTAADHGTHTFSVDLKTAGAPTLVAYDPTAGVTAREVIFVYPAAVSTFQVSNFPSPVGADTYSQFVVTAYDSYGNQVTDYTGTVVLSSTDPAATFFDDATGNPLAGNSYTFTAADAGTHYFDATLATVGTQSITVTDASVTPAATGSQTGIQVLPVATLTGPPAGYPSQALTFTLGAIGDPPGTGFTYQIDWNGDGVVDQTVTGPSGTTVTHAYAAAGDNAVAVTATDPGGFTSPQTFQYVNILPVTVAVQTDPAHTAQQMLVITDTGYGDSFQLSSAAGNEVSLTIDGNAVGTVAPTTSSPFALVEVLGGAGNNLIDARNLAVSAVLAGGAGNDTLYGGSGRNLLIGGTGADALHAGSAGNILIGGSTSYDSNPTALAFVMAEWDSADSYSTRISRLMKGGGQNGSYVLNSSTVFDDNTIDALYGGAGLDWFLAHKKGRRSDQVINRTSGEVVTSI
jgi:hypothetical protein